MSIETIQKKKVGDLELPFDVVSNVAIDNAVVQDSSKLVTGGAVYSALEDLSIAIMDNYANNTNTGSPALFKSMRMSNLFDFDPNVLSGNIPIVNSQPTQNVVSVKLTDVIENPTDANFQANEKMLSSYSGPLDGVDYTMSRFFRIPSLVRMNSGRLVASFDIRWQSSKDISQTGLNDQATGISYSDDDGYTWSQPRIAIQWTYPKYTSSKLSGYQSGVSDPGLVYDEEHDVLMLFSIGGRGFQNIASAPLSEKYGLESFARQQLVFSWSKDGGETWADPISLNSKVFDDASMATQNWASTYKYLFSCCSPGLTLRRQSDETKNGLIILPIQLHTMTASTTSANVNIRTSHLVIRPQYSNSNSVTGLSAYFLGGMTPNSLIGEKCGGADEGQLCEGPNGELVRAVKAYRVESNPYGSRNNCKISIRIYKSTDLGQTWEAIGDCSNSSYPNDMLCKTLETALRVKPAIGYFPSLSCYVVGYTQSLFDRNYSVLRYSNDLVTWKMLYALENRTNFGYQSILQTNMKSKRVEGLFEACEDKFLYNGSSFTQDIVKNETIYGAARQLKYYCFDFKNGQFMLERSNRHTELGYIESELRGPIKGISFKPNIFSTADKTIVKSISIQVGQIKPVNLDNPQLNNKQVWCILFDGIGDEALPIAHTGHCISTTNEMFKFDFSGNDGKVVLEKDKQYFLLFQRDETIPEDWKPSTRGPLSNYSNVMYLYACGTKTATSLNDAVAIWSNTSAQTVTDMGSTFYLQPIMSLSLV